MKLHEAAERLREYVQQDQYVSPQDFQAALARAGIPNVNFYQEMEMFSRYVDAHTDENRSGDLLQLHSHSFYEVLYTCGGRVQYLLGEERYSLQRGDIVFIPPGLSHRPLLPDSMDEHYRRYVMWLSAEFIERIRALSPELHIMCLPQGRVLRTKGSAVGDLLQGYFTRAADEERRKLPGWQAALCAEAMLMLVQLERAFQDLRAQIPAAEKQELLDNVLAYIQAHLADKITLRNTARRFLVSESAISQLFHKRLNISFYRCVTQHRLIAAKNLIMRGERPGAVYGRLGFTDYSSFYRAFRQEYGVSPGQYRGGVDEL